MCSVCIWTGHVACHCPDAQCYGCNEFGHFSQDCPHKIPSLRTPCHHGRSQSRHHYNHNQRDRSHSNYGCKHRRCHSKSVMPCSCLNRSSSFRRHTLHSSPSHYSSLCHPSANRCSHYPLCHSCTPSHTHHFSHRHHSCHSTDLHQSHSSNFCHTTLGYQPRKVKQHPRPSTTHKLPAPKTVTIQDSHSESSSDSDSDSDPLNY